MWIGHFRIKYVKLTFLYRNFYHRNPSKISVPTRPIFIGKHAYRKGNTFDSMYFLDVESIAGEERSVHVLEICHKLANVAKDQGV